MGSGEPKLVDVYELLAELDCCQSEGVICHLLTASQCVRSEILSQRGERMFCHLTAYPSLRHPVLRALIFGYV